MESDMIKLVGGREWGALRSILFVFPLLQLKIYFLSVIARVILLATGGINSPWYFKRETEMEGS